MTRQITWKGLKRCLKGSIIYGVEYNKQLPKLITLELLTTYDWTKIITWLLFLLAKINTYLLNRIPHALVATTILICQWETVFHICGRQRLVLQCCIKSFYLLINITVTLMFFFFDIGSGWCWSQIEVVATVGAGDLWYSVN